MSLLEVEKAVTQMSSGELSAFRDWFADFDMARWDRQIEEDSAAGRLDGMIAKALEEHRAGHTTGL
ncbi:MAG: hypothetical protein LBK76_03655 [Verrucomicrobiales bacterium]|jgi:hypothetical protein|nr:hypothetical protein [Verrucomicrobiales bacterium]